MQVFHWDKQTQKKLSCGFDAHFDKEVYKKVARILAEVRQFGDVAVRRFTRQFDGIDLPLKRLQVAQGDINRAFEQINVEFVPILKKLLKM